jgi:hypothetical protein
MVIDGLFLGMAAWALSARRKGPSNEELAEGPRVVGLVGAHPRSPWGGGATAPRTSSVVTPSAAANG